MKSRFSKWLKSAATIGRRRKAPSIKAMRVQAMQDKGWCITYAEPEMIFLETDNELAAIHREGDMGIKTGDDVRCIARDDAQGFADWIGIPYRRRWWQYRPKWWQLILLDTRIWLVFLAALSVIAASCMFLGVKLVK